MLAELPTHWTSRCLLHDKYTTSTLPHHLINVENDTTTKPTHHRPHGPGVSGFEPVVPPRIESAGSLCLSLDKSLLLMANQLTGLLSSSQTKLPAYNGLRGLNKREYRLTAGLLTLLKLTLYAHCRHVGDVGAQSVAWSGCLEQIELWALVWLLVSVTEFGNALDEMVRKCKENIKSGVDETVKPSLPILLGDNFSAEKLFETAVKFTQYLRNSPLRNRDVKNVLNAGDGGNIVMLPAVGGSREGLEGEGEGVTYFGSLEARRARLEETNRRNLDTDNKNPGSETGSISKTVSPLASPTRPRGPPNSRIGTGPRRISRDATPISSNGKGMGGGRYMTAYGAAVAFRRTMEGLRSPYRFGIGLKSGGLLDTPSSAPTSMLVSPRTLLRTPMQPELVLPFTTNSSSNSCGAGSEDSSILPQLVFCLLQGWVERVVHSELGIELSCDGPSDGDGDSDSNNAAIHSRRIMKQTDSLFGFGAFSWSEVLEGMLGWIFDSKYTPKASNLVRYLVIDEEGEEGKERGQSGRQKFRRGLRKLGRIAILWTKKNKRDISK